MDNFYCSQKFTFLSVHIEKQVIKSCCSADSEKIDKDWLLNNSGQLFNTPTLLRERQMMLENQPAPSCESSCWRPEQENFSSRRTVMGTDQVTHTQINTAPEFVDLCIGYDCNMSCIYCARSDSSTWANDILKNGSYNITDYDINDNDQRYNLTDRDRIMLKLSQKDRKQYDHQNIILSETLKILPSAKKVEITGGEPFLNLHLEEIFRSIGSDVEISICSGLGVNETRFRKELEKLKAIRNFSITVSGESTNAMYEFTRNGNTWNQYLANLEIIRKLDIPIVMNCVLSNVTMFGFNKFCEMFPTDPKMISILSVPSFLAMNVMDDASKSVILSNLKSVTADTQLSIESSMQVPHTDRQRSNFAQFVCEYARRRDLDLGIFPKSFVDWINNVV